VTPRSAQIAFLALAAIASIGLAWPFIQSFILRIRGHGKAISAPSSTGSSSYLGSPLVIEFENDDKHDRQQYLAETGIFRRTIHVSVLNNSFDDIQDCNIRLIAATPRPNTGDNPVNLPIHFGGHFDLPSKQRKFIQIVSFAENPANATILERDHIIISAASGGLFPGWTTLPIQSRDNPAILTLEAFAPGVAPRTAHLHIWIDQRRIYAKII
jgi:hypothetical protein